MFFGDCWRSCRAKACPYQKVRRDWNPCGYGFGLLPPEAVHAVLTSLFAGLFSSCRTRASLQVEIVALCHQREVLQRTRRRQIPLRAMGRLLWFTLHRLWPEWRRSLVLVRPDTVIGWHRKGFRLYWRWKSRQRRGGHPAAVDLQGLSPTPRVLNIRKLDPFRRFLEVAAQCNGEIVNYSNVARDIGTDHKTVSSYFEILEDTLLGFLLEPYHASVRKRQRQAPKFFFFDPGVTRAIAGTLNVDLVPGTYEFGRGFEHFVLLEIFRLSNYRQKDYRFSYLRTKDGAEIDLVVERPGEKLALVEIKSTDRVDERDIRDLSRFLPDFPNARAFCFSRDEVRKQIGDVLAVPWRSGLEELSLLTHARSG